ncbi:hypothetical protein LCGC14_0778310 [marine sediment metagenome]|uniref:Uncharacterized protein n=1 Tax=marine sediment metagenome TaxID=412755 RepID=A0A0F9Q0H1_9ZZZZ
MQNEICKYIEYSVINNFFQFETLENLSMNLV